MATLPGLLHFGSWSIAASYTGLGLFAIVSPLRGARILGVRSAPSSSPSSTNTVLLMRLLGARDLSIGAALFVFAYQREYKAMGSLIVSGTILCFADVVSSWVADGPALALPMGIGAAIWTAIGIKLVAL